MNRETKIVAALLVAMALGLAVLAIVLGRQTPVQAPSMAAAPTADAAPSYPVVVADTDLVPGEVLEAKHLKVVNLSIFPTGTKGDVDAFIGKKPVRAIPAGRPIYDSDLGVVNVSPLAIAKHERAIAISVDEVSGSNVNRINAGDFVDVFFAWRDPANVEQSQARLLLSRVRVVSYGSAVVDNVAATQVSSINRPAVLAISLAEVPRLLLATQHGRLTLVQRPADDETVADASLFEKAGPVLGPRPGLTDAQRAALQDPNNQAFAGMNLGGLTRSANSANPARPSPSVPVPPAGMAPVASPVSPAPRAAPRAAPGSQVEIIRGTQTEAQPF